MIQKKFHNNIMYICVHIYVSSLLNHSSNNTHELYQQMSHDSWTEGIVAINRTKTDTIFFIVPSYGFRKL